MSSVELNIESKRFTRDLCLFKIEAASDVELLNGNINEFIIGHK